MTNQSIQARPALRATLIVMMSVVVLGLLAMFVLRPHAAPAPERYALNEAPVVMLHENLEDQVSERVKRQASRPLDMLRSTMAAQPSLVKAVSTRFRVEPRMAHHIVGHAQEVSKEVGLPVTLILGVIARESSFNPQAVDHQDVGLMQVNLKWHADKIADAGGADKMFNPEVNIRVGARILKEYVDMAGSYHGGLRRYNGLGKANNYPDEVLAFMRAFQPAA